MFLTGPLMVLPLLDRGSMGSALNISAVSNVELVGSSAWGRMLAEADAKVAYFVEIEPWVLADRS